MASLKSEHFTKVGTDLSEATRDTLEQCRNGDPSPVQSHFSTKDNRRGEHVRRVKQALELIQKQDTKLKLHSFKVDDVYDSDFALAVKDYKAARNIRNHSNAIDDVVGQLTMKEMDKELPKATDPDPPADNRKKIDVVIRLEGNRVEGNMLGDQVLPSRRHRQVYTPVATDKLLFNETTERFLLLDGWFLHDTGDKAKGMLNQSLKMLKGVAGDVGTIDRVYFYGSSAGGRSVLDFADLTRQSLGSLTMIGVADAHFTQDDTTDKPQGEADTFGAIANPTNIPSFRGFAGTQTTSGGNRFNWFQIAGNHGKKRHGVGEAVFTSNFDGEIHGTVDGYFNFPAMQVSDAAESDDVRAHEEACVRGLVIMEDKIIVDLMSA